MEEENKTIQTDAPEVAEQAPEQKVVKSRKKVKRSVPAGELFLEGLVHALLALYPVLADEFGADDEGGEMLAVAVEFEMVANHSGLDELLDLVGVHHGFSF